MANPDKFVPQPRLSQSKIKEKHRYLYIRAIDLLQKYADSGSYHQSLPQTDLPPHAQNASYITGENSSQHWYVELYYPGSLKINNQIGNDVCIFKTIYLNPELRKDPYFTSDPIRRSTIEFMEIALSDNSTVEAEIREPAKFPDVESPLLNTRRATRLATKLLDNFEAFLQNNPGALIRSHI